MDKIDWYKGEVDVEYLPSEVYENVCKNMNIDPDDENSRKRISKMRPYDVLDRFLTWEGLMGFTSSIIEAVEGIQEAHLETLEK